MIRRTSHGAPLLLMSTLQRSEHCRRRAHALLTLAHQLETATEPHAVAHRAALTRAARVLTDQADKFMALL